MPRLTAKQYLPAHDQLRRFWLHQPRVFGELTPGEQWRLHHFFKPSHDLSDLELLQHREQVTKTRPSLPRQAGRALAKLQSAAAVVAVEGVRRAKAPAPVKIRRSRGERRLVVRAVVRPEPDIKKLAQALLEMARAMVQRRRELVGRVVTTASVDYQPDPTAKLPYEIERVL